MLRAVRGPAVWAVLIGVIFTTGCPRPVGEPDAGTADPCEEDPGPGNAFDGAMSLDDERVRAIDPTCLRQGATACRPPFLARVTQVLDGDTIQVLGEGIVVNARVRMIGIDTPEVSHDGSPSDCYGPEANDFTEQLDGRLVYVSFDADCYDDFDRLLGYVHVGEGTGDMWQRQLLRRGLATAFTINPNRSFAAQFQDDEREAESRNQGLWSACF